MKLKQIQNLNFSFSANIICNWINLLSINRNQSATSNENHDLEFTYNYD